ncbi:MAG TPA: septum formation initiator family protein [Candidatus Saccharimonadales bacterium]|jgi:cell division protein FtsL|nr:septum formation initiator family protein [Candidatus Saccharimonadales bacterium]
MIDKIKKYYRSMPWESLRDMRTIGMLVFVVIVVLITWSGVKTVQTNYNLQKQVATLQEQNQVQKLENDNLQLENDYYNTNQYLDLSARQEFGLGAPGEKELLVPQSVALANLAAIPASQTTSTKPNIHQSVYERNFEAWMDFFLRRSTISD